MNSGLKTKFLIWFFACKVRIEQYFFFILYRDWDTFWAKHIIKQICFVLSGRGITFHNLLYKKISSYLYKLDVINLSSSLICDICFFFVYDCALRPLSIVMLGQLDILATLFLGEPHRGLLPVFSAHFFQHQLRNALLNL